MATECNEVFLGEQPYENGAVILLDDERKKGLRNGLQLQSHIADRSTRLRCIQSSWKLRIF